MQSDSGDPSCKMFSACFPAVYLLTMAILLGSGGCWPSKQDLCANWYFMTNAALNYPPPWMCYSACEWQRTDAAKEPTRLFVFAVRFCLSDSIHKWRRRAKKKSLAYNRYKQNISSHNDFPITHSQLTVWQHWPVYYSVGLYHVALPLIPWKAWKSQTTEMLISPKGKREEIKRQSCKK